MANFQTSKLWLRPASYVRFGDLKTQINFFRSEASSVVSKNSTVPNKPLSSINNNNNSFNKLTTSAVVESPRPSPESIARENKAAAAVVVADTPPNSAPLPSKFGGVGRAGQAPLPHNLLMQHNLSANASGELKKRASFTNSR